MSRSRCFIFKLHGGKARWAGLIATDNSVILQGGVCLGRLERQDDSWRAWKPICAAVGPYGATPPVCEEVFPSRLKAALWLVEQWKVIEGCV